MASSAPPPKDEMDVSDLKPPPITSSYKYKCPLLRSKFTIGALLIYLLLPLLSSAFTALQIILLFLDGRGKVTPPILWDINAKAWNYLEGAAFPAFVLTAIVFATWVYRVSANAITFDPRKITDTAAMSVIWYFIPIANLFKPYQSMKAINAVSSSHGHFSAARLLPWWWALWLITGWVEQIFQVIWSGVETNDQIMNVSAFYQITYLGECALTILAIIMVRRITCAQRLHHDPACLPTNSASAPSALPS